MSRFQYPSLTDLVQAINAANGTSFLNTDLSFSLPKVVSGSWQGIASDRNTAIRASAAAPAYQGYVTVQYNRLDLAQLANLPGLHLAAYQPAKTYDLLPAILYFMGIQFVQGDLQNLDITLNGDGSGTAVLTADPNSLGWIGTVSIPFVAGGQGIDSAITTVAMPGLNYPVADASAPPATAVYGPAYLYPYDFTAYQSTFLTYTTGTPTQAQLDYILAAIKALDIGAGATLWVDTGSNTSYNLTGATIGYNGLNNANTMPTNPNYKYVLRLDLAATQTAPAGSLYLHYNDPFDANNF
jgi:hypothetical protein